jgi:hypothetical protein
MTRFSFLIRLFSIFLLVSCSILPAANTPLTKLASVETRLALRNMDMDNTYFIYLPDELLNRIASFIDDNEFDEEFIEHALKLSDIPDKLRQKALKECFDCDALLSYSFDKQKVYRFHVEVTKHDRQSYERISKHCIASFDIKTSNFKDLSVEFGESFDDRGRSRCFAISPDEKHVAQLVAQLGCDGYVKSYVIACTKSGESKPYKTFDVSDIYNPWCQEDPSLAFNQKSTKIIISVRKKKDIFTAQRPYKLFHLNPESEHEKLGAKTLIGYFKHLTAKYKKQ